MKLVRKKIFIATHANLSEGFKNAAKLIVGNSADDITTFSLNEGDSAEDFKNEIKQYKEEHAETDVLVLTDLYGASLFNAMIALHAIKGIYILTGINLSLLLDLLLEDRAMDYNLLQEKIEGSKKGMMLLENIDVSVEDDF